MGWKSVAPVFAVFIVVFAAPAWAAPPAGEGSSSVSFFVEPILQKGLGGVAYDLSFYQGGGYTGRAASSSPNSRWRQAWRRAFLSLRRSGWLVEASIAHSTVAFSGSMNDYDWTQYLSYPKVPFSYTYSPDSTVSWHASLEAAWTFAFAKPWSLALYGTYRYQDVSHVEDGYTGWHYAPDATSDGYVPMVITSTTPDVLEYTLSTHTIGVGLMGEVQPLPWAFPLSFGPPSLRSTHPTVTITSCGPSCQRLPAGAPAFYGDMRATYVLSRSAGITPYLALEGEVIYYVVSTTQTQYWYGNADAANGAPQGTLITGAWACHHKRSIRGGHQARI